MGRFEELFDLASKQEDNRTRYVVYMVSEKDQCYNLTVEVDSDEDMIYQQLDEVLPKSDNVIKKLVYLLIPGMFYKAPSSAFRKALERHNSLNRNALVALPGVIERTLKDMIPPHIKEQKNESCL